MICRSKKPLVSTKATVKGRFFNLIVCTMTAKEKAEELVQRMQAQRYMSLGASSQCALICVDEILTFIEDADPQSLSYELMGYRDYWQEVKQQIKKL